MRCAVMGNLRRVAQAAGNGSPSPGFIGVEGVGAAANLLTILADGLDELLGDGSASDLIEGVDPGKELAAAAVELGRGRGSRFYVVWLTTLSGIKKRKTSTPFFCHVPIRPSQGVLLTEI